MVQKFLPEITEGDKRVLVIGGKPVPYCLARIPQGNEVRGNLAAGGKGVAQPLSQHDKAMAEEIGPPSWSVDCCWPVSMSSASASPRSM